MEGQRHRCHASRAEKRQAVSEAHLAAMKRGKRVSFSEAAVELARGNAKQGSASEV